MRGRLSLIAAAMAVACSLGAQAAGAPERAREPDLVIYTYDSFVSEWGPAGQVVPPFEAEHGVTVKIVSVGDAGQVLNRLILEKGAPRADVAIGLDNNMLARARAEGVLEPYRPPAAGSLPPEAVFDPTFHLTPYDYGYFAFIVDTQALTDPPDSLEELTDPRFREKIILQDPRTSSPGLGFLLWTVAVYGDGYVDYWKRLAPNILTITEGWDAAYGMFTAGEAPLVLSYTTSPAYHAEHENTTRYQALVFPEGNYLQVEGIGVVRGTGAPALARAFVDYALSKTFQDAIPLTNWMYPVSPAARIPDSFRHAPKPSTTLNLDADLVAGGQERWIAGWLRAVGR